MQLTQAHGSVLLQQPEPVKANYPGERGRGSRGCRSRQGRQSWSCHSQLPPMFYLCQDTPDQRTIKPFYRGLITETECKMATQLVGEISAVCKGLWAPRTEWAGGHGGDSPWCSCAPVPNTVPKLSPALTPTLSPILSPTMSPALILVQLCPCPQLYPQHCPQPCPQL